MQDLFLAIQAWPVIIQGALGSGLFALVVSLGQYSTKKIASKYSHYSKKTRKTWLLNRSIQLRAQLSKTQSEKGAYAALLIYRASRPLFKSFIWLSLGLISQALFLPISVVGFAGSLYYLFQGYNVIAPLSDAGANELLSQLESVQQELKEIEKV